GVLINLYVWLPCRKNEHQECDYETLSMSGLGHIAGQARVDLRPSWLQSEEDFAADVLESLRRGMNWYDQFSDPEKCLRYLRQHVKPTTSQSYIGCERYLSSLVPDPTSGADGLR